MGKIKVEFASMAERRRYDLQMKGRCPNMGSAIYTTPKGKFWKCGFCQMNGLFIWSEFEMSNKPAQRCGTEAI